MDLIFKVRVISFLFCCKEIFANTSQHSNERLLYRYEGNFYPVYAAPRVLQRYPRQHEHIAYLQPVQLSHQIYHEDQMPLTTGNGYQVEPLQRVVSSGKREESASGVLPVKKSDPIGRQAKEVPRRTDRVIRHYHDIFLKLKSPHDLVFGHVLNWPESAEKKIEKRRGNSYKGQVVWADRKGGYGEHYWDLAQGAL